MTKKFAIPTVTDVLLEVFGEANRPLVESSLQRLDSLAEQERMADEFFRSLTASPALAGRGVAAAPSPLPGDAFSRLEFADFETGFRLEESLI